MHKLARELLIGNAFGLLVMLAGASIYGWLGYSWPPAIQVKDQTPKIEKLYSERQFDQVKTMALNCLQSQQPAEDYMSVLLRDTPYEIAKHLALFALIPFLNLVALWRLRKMLAGTP